MKFKETILGVIIIGVLTTVLADFISNYLKGEVIEGDLAVNEFVETYNSFARKGFEYKENREWSFAILEFENALLLLDSKMDSSQNISARLYNKNFRVTPPREVLIKELEICRIEFIFKEANELLQLGECSAAKLLINSLPNRFLTDSRIVEINKKCQVSTKPNDSPEPNGSSNATANPQNHFSFSEKIKVVIIGSSELNNSNPNLASNISELLNNVGIKSSTSGVKNSLFTSGAISDLFIGDFSVFGDSELKNFIDYLLIANHDSIVENIISEKHLFSTSYTIKIFDVQNNSTIESFSILSQKKLPEKTDKSQVLRHLRHEFIMKLRDKRLDLLKRILI